jgi:hypothetical protein
MISVLTDIENRMSHTPFYQVIFRLFLHLYAFSFHVVCSFHSVKLPFLLTSRSFLDGLSNIQLSQLSLHTPQDLGIRRRLDLNDRCSGAF